MKTRLSHVTNSSSSSFIINRNNVSKDKLIDILLEIANEERKYWDEDGYKYTLEEDVHEETEEDDIYHPESKMFEPRERLKTVVAGRYIINEGTEENPYVDWDGYEYTNDYIVDNESCVRYDWCIVDEVLEKYSIPWRRGYCD